MKAIIFTALLSIIATPIEAKRIVSAGGSVTEILYALDLGSEIVAVDSSSYYPAEATQKPHVGYFRTLSAEGVLAMQPDLLVVGNGGGPKEALDQIAQQGVIVKVFKQEKYNLSAWKAYLRDIGSYFNRDREAEAIINRVEHQMKTIGTTQQRRNALFLLNIGDRGPVAAGQNTVPDMLFALANINNQATTFEGYKPLSTEALVSFRPDLIVMPSHTVEQMGGQEAVCQNIILKLATVEQGCQLLVIDALLVLGYGTRIDEAVLKLAKDDR